MSISRRSFILDATAVTAGAVLASSPMPLAAEASSAAAEPAPPPSGLPRWEARAFPPGWIPAYLSNGLIGIRPGVNPLAPALTVVSGYTGASTPDQTEALAPAPYPLALEFAPGQLATETQSLDLASGELTTRMVFTPPGGAPVQVEVLQFASRSVPALLCQQVTLTARAAASVRLTARIAPPPPEQGRPYFSQAPPRNEVDLVLGWESRGALGRIGAAVQCILEGSDAQPRRSDGRWEVVLELRPGQPVRLSSIAALVASFYHSQPELQAIRMAGWGKTLGFDLLREQNRQAWAELWRGRVLVEADAATQNALDGAFFYLHASLHRSNLNGMPPFGLSQFDRYNGHSFWDTETWCLPPLLLTAPEIARSLLLFRLRGLEAARRLAALYGRDGAQYPWEAGQLEGADVTPTFAGTGWMEQHITVDIGWAVWLGQLAAGNAESLRGVTWPILRETAQWILSRGVFTARGFEIQHMMGPDESVGDVANSSYVNVLAKMALEAAVACAAAVGAQAPPAWSRAAKAMVVPLSADRRVILPYDGARPGPRYSLGNMDILAVNEPPLPRSLLRDTFFFEQKLRPSQPVPLGFALAATAVSAAQFGAAQTAAELFRAAWENDWVAPFGLAKEAPSENYAGFLTNSGSLLRSVLLGFSGVRIQSGEWRAAPAALPAGWRRIEAARLWVRGEPRRLVATAGALPLLAPLSAAAAAGA